MRSDANGRKCNIWLIASHVDKSNLEVGTRRSNPTVSVVETDLQIGTERGCCRIARSVVNML